MPAAESDTKKKGRRRTVAAAVLIVLAAVLGWWALARPTVRVVAVRRGDLVDTLSAIGVVEAAQARVAPKVVGRVEALLVGEGDSVRQGQLLARLDATGLRAALREREAGLRMAQAEVTRIVAALEQERAASRARVEGAQAAEQAADARLQELQRGARPQEIESARQAAAAARAEERLAASDLERISRLLDEDAVSRADADAAQARLRSARAALRAAEENLDLLEEGARSEQVAAARADLNAARAQLAAARAAAGQVTVLEKSVAAARAAVAQAEAGVAAAKSALVETEVTAPISGRVGRRYLDVGDLAGPTAPMFLVTNDDDLWVTAEVDEEDLSLVHPGQQVEVSVEALPQALPGKVAYVGPVAVSRGLAQVRAKIVRCKVVLDRGQELLKPGMEVDISARAILSKGALLVPAGAVAESDDGQSILVVTDGVVRRRAVEVGHSNYREVEVTSGLDEGDLVVVADDRELRDGQRVAVRRE